MTIHSWYSLFKWFAILAMGWIWKDMPMLKAKKSDTNFLNKVWLDILDAIVFADYMLNDAMTFPRVDPPLVFPGGRPCASKGLADDACVSPLSDMVWYVWPGSRASLV